IFAKLNNVKVLKFSLGFGPKILGRKIGETEYLLSAVPLGGYVKMLGEDLEDRVENEDMTRSYQNKPVPQRALIILAGPIFNLLSAVVIFFFVFIAGTPILLPEIGEIMPDTAASRALIQKGDRIIEINGRQVNQWTDMTEIIQKNANKPLTLKIQRDSGHVTIPIVPESKKMKDLFGEEKEVGMIGVKPSGNTILQKHGIISAAKNAVLKTWDISVLTVIGIVKLVERIIPAETIGGPILIFQLAEKQASAGALSFFVFAAIISINLGLLNLLPIPVLDGGHLLFLGIEALRGKPISERVVIIAQRIGLAALILLMAFAMYNDIFRLVNGKPLP
ncbi:MAG: RIP metalloprotease RseP, partial [Nitrospirae bacterium]|nr:RIP metalloprotease RseP [Nitrospirota bacterium]